MKIAFAGTPQFAVPFLQALIDSPHYICAVYTQPDRPAGRGQKITASPVKEFAEKNQLTIFQPASLKDFKAQEEFETLQADVLVNVAYGLLLPETILTATKFGCVNVHPSLLPRWRGAAPIQRAIMAGDTETGVSIMQMDKGLDTGGIYQQEKFPIEKNDTTLSIMEKAVVSGVKLLLEVLNDIALDIEKVVPQDDTLSTYAKKLNKEEAKINWELSAIAIDRMIRAFIPWPIAFTTIDNVNIRVWEAEALEGKHHALPGTIIACNKYGIDVATGNGILCLKKIQLPNHKALTVIDILNSHTKLFVCGKQFV